MSLSGGFFLLPPHPPTPTRPSPPPAHPSPCNSGPKLMCTCKNRLKRPKIKQGRTSKVNYILFNRLLSPVLLNKSGLARAKAINFNSNFLNKCFSNYYQVRTWLVFAETVTYCTCSNALCNLFIVLVLVVYYKGTSLKCNGNGSLNKWYGNLTPPKILETRLVTCLLLLSENSSDSNDNGSEWH